MSAKTPRHPPVAIECMFCPPGGFSVTAIGDEAAFQGMGDHMEHLHPEEEHIPASALVRFRAMDEHGRPVHQ